MLLACLNFQLLDGDVLLHPSVLLEVVLLHAVVPLSVAQLATLHIPVLDAGFALLLLRAQPDDVLRT